MMWSETSVLWQDRSQTGWSQIVGSVLWNEIPQLLKHPMSKYTFKRKLKAHLLNEQAIF